MVAAPDMGQLVGEDRGLRFAAQAGEQSGGQDQSPGEPDRPDQGRQMTGRHPHVGDAPQAQPAREPGDHRADVRRRRPGLADDPRESANTGGIARGRAAGTTDPDGGEDRWRATRARGRLSPRADSGVCAAGRPRESRRGIRRGDAIGRPRLIVNGRTPESLPRSSVPGRDRREGEGEREPGGDQRRREELEQDDDPEGMDRRGVPPDAAQHRWRRSPGSWRRRHYWR